MNQVLKNGILFMLGSLLFYFIVYFVLFKTGFLSEIPNNINLLNWDASWYNSIVAEGYYLDLENQCNSGFFPGFPYLWGLLGLSPIGISIINGILFLGAVYMLKIITSTSLFKVLFIISLPSTFFFFTPYSESLFYFFAVLFIVYWINDKLIGVIFSALIFSFVRPVFFFLIPAIIGIYLLKIKRINNLKKPGLTIIFLLTGAILGFAIIGYETGDFFAYSKSQIVQWKHDFKLPSLPLTTWRGYRILWLDALALCVTVMAMSFLIVEFYRVQFLKKSSKFSAIETVSLGYLLMILIYVLFFHPVEDGRTTILSINRYVFCNPFLHFLILKRIHSIDFKLNKFYIPLISSGTVLLLIGFPFYSIVELSYSKSIIFSIGLFMFLMVFSLVFFKIRYKRLLLTLLILMFFFLQLYLYNSFLKGNWIG